MTPEEFWKQLQDKIRARTNFVPLEWAFRFAKIYHTAQCAMDGAVSGSDNFK